MQGFASFGPKLETPSLKLAAVATSPRILRSRDDVKQEYVHVGFSSGQARDVCGSIWTAQLDDMLRGLMREAGQPCWEAVSTMLFGSEEHVHICKQRWSEVRSRCIASFKKSHCRVSSRVASKVMLAQC